MLVLGCDWGGLVGFFDGFWLDVSIVVEIDWASA